MSPILEFDSIVTAYKKGVPVLNGVSFSMAEGEVVGLLGPQRLLRYARRGFRAWVATAPMFAAFFFILAPFPSFAGAISSMLCCCAFQASFRTAYGCWR